MNVVTLHLGSEDFTERRAKVSAELFDAYSKHEEELQNP
jgi:hypothetical protein